MIDIIALFFLCKKMGNLAIQKGLKAGAWKVYTVLAWFTAEMMGMILGMSFFGQVDIIKDNLVGIMLLGLACAFGGYLLSNLCLIKNLMLLMKKLTG